MCPPTFKVVALKKNRYVLYRSHRPPWCPSFVTAVRILIIIRVSGAMYTNISDCDEGALPNSSSAKGVRLKNLAFFHQCTISGNRCITLIEDMGSRLGKPPRTTLSGAGPTSCCTSGLRRRYRGFWVSTRCAAFRYYVGDSAHVRGSREQCSSVSA